MTGRQRAVWFPPAALVARHAKRPFPLAHHAAARHHSPAPARARPRSPARPATRVAWPPPPSQPAGYGPAGCGSAAPCHSRRRYFCLTAVTRAVVPPARPRPWFRAFATTFAMRNPRLKSPRFSVRQYVIGVTTGRWAVATLPSSFRYAARIL